MDTFWNATEAFGDLIIAKMDFVGLEVTFWVWFLLAVGMWLHNVREWLLRKRMERRVRMERHARRCFEGGGSSDGFKKED